jgi:hypothetical protein|tara:strand:- start:5431 stop:6573 length:1143 start_codon:yes stop_codon:yes gene_type:complete
MAITRLTDIIQVFEDKWTYGDVKFGYDGELNQDHDVKYPLLLIEPPESTIPEIFDGRELYTFEINFYNLYTQAAQSAVKLQQRWDNLQDLGNEWLDFTLKHFQDDTVTAYLDDESIEIARVKEVGNDRLVHVKFTFTISAFTKCFRPVSNYPSDLSDLVLWYKADSKVTFDIATKRVSAWKDGKGELSVANPSTGKQPLRHGFDGPNEKAFISFDGVDDLLASSVNNPITSKSYTIFMVAKQTTTFTDAKPVYSYRRSANLEILVGFKNNNFYSEVTNSSDTLSSSLTADSSNYGLLCTSLSVSGSTGTLTSSFNGGSDHVTSDASWTGFTYDGSTFNIGGKTGVFVGADVGELIVFNRALTDNEKSDMKDYLNKKFKIY